MMQNLKGNWLVVPKLTWGIWQILTRALGSLKNIHFDVLFLSRVFIVWAKKVQRSYLSWHWRVIQNLERNRHVVSKLTWGIWQILTRALENLENFDFNGLFLSRVYIAWAKKVQRSYLSWHWRVIQNSERNRLIVCFKIDMRNLTNFDLSTWKLQKNFPLIGSFSAKYVLFELKKYRGVFFHDTEERYKIWRQIGLLFWNWHEEFDKSSPDHSKVSKLGLWWDPFVQSWKFMSLKFTEESCVMTMKNDMTWGIWWILTRALKNLKNLLFNWLLWPMYIMYFVLKRSYVWWHWRFWRKTDLCFQKWHEEFGKFA